MCVQICFHIKLVPVALSSRVQWLVTEVKKQRPSNVGVKNEWRRTSISAHTVMLYIGTTVSFVVMSQSSVLSAKRKFLVLFKTRKAGWSQNYTKLEYWNYVHVSDHFQTWDTLFSLTICEEISRDPCRFGQLQPTGTPHDSFRTCLRAAVLLPTRSKGAVRGIVRV
jgi:hypothetical protein